MTNNGNSRAADARETLWELIKDIRFSMFTTRHRDGHLHSRPMTTQNSRLDEDSNLWFFAKRGTDPVTDIAAEPGVNISYAEPGKDSYVSVCGTASVVEDASKKKQLWSKMAAAWFPGGVDDPELALIKVDIVHAHYWDVTENKAVQLFKMAKAAVIGERPENLGEHGEVRMR